MKHWLAGAVALAMSAGVAAAQDFRAGVYDGRSIPGWTYSQTMSEAGGAPTWAPSDGSADQDGANCNLQASPVAADRAQWQGYFSGLTAEAFGAQLRAEGLDVHSGNRVSPITLDGRPALRHEMSATASGGRFDFQTILLSGADTLLTMTCTVVEGRYAARLPLIQQFVGGMRVLTAPPQ
jgi:hypothetical protein